MTTSKELLQDLRRLHPSLIDLSLGRVERALSELGNPQNALPPVVHVAGTNGKGSVVAFLKAMLEAAGLRVHVFTSPHLVHFHERIQLATGPGQSSAISEDALIDVLERTELANNGVPITFFEITTAAAFLAFSEHPADVVLLETGLGGRLDATNVVARPALTIIMPVSSDHNKFLGDTVAEIAFEKAGILKKDVTCVVARQPSDAFEVIEAQAERVSAPLIKHGRDWDAFEQHGRLLYQEEEIFFDLPLPALHGPHQVENAGAAIAALRQLKDFDISEREIERGLQNVTWPARLERLGDGALSRFIGTEDELWLDGGHNAAAGVVLARALAGMEDRVPKPLYLVVGMLETKDAARFFQPFSGLVREAITVPVPGSEKSYTSDELAKIAQGAGLEARPMDSLEEGLKAASGNSVETRRILICGSLYLAGHVLAEHGKVLS